MLSSSRYGRRSAGFGPGNEEESPTDHDSRNPQHRRKKDSVPFAGFDLQRAHIERAFVRGVGESAVGNGQNAGQDQNDAQDLHRNSRSSTISTMDIVETGTEQLRVESAQITSRPREAAQKMEKPAEAIRFRPAPACRNLA